MSIERSNITGHFMAHWGVPNDIRPHKLEPFGDLAIIEFAPRNLRSTWRYATNGMSSKVQEDEADGVRTEIYLSSTERIRWADDLLLAIAAYPFLNHTSLSEFDTISAGQPVDQGTSPYTGVLLTPPAPFDPETLERVMNFC